MQLAPNLLFGWGVQRLGSAAITRFVTHFSAVSRSAAVALEAPSLPGSWQEGLAVEPREARRPARAPLWRHSPLRVAVRLWQDANEALSRSTDACPCPHHVRPTCPTCNRWLDGILRPEPADTPAARVQASAHFVDCECGVTVRLGNWRPAELPPASVPLFM